MTSCTRMPTFFRHLLSALFSLTVASLCASQPPSTFSNLGYLATGGVNGISANGQVIFGHVYDFSPETTVERTHVWQLTPDGWELSYMDSDASLNTSGVAISADGSTIAGSIRVPNPDTNSFSKDLFIATVWHHESNQWVRTELDSGGRAAFATAVSSDGHVVIGTVQNEHGAERGHVWEYINGVWTGSDLTATDGSRTIVTAPSSDGSIIIGNHNLSPYGSEPMVWMRNNGVWNYTILPCDPSAVFNGASAMSSDGWSILGSTKVNGLTRPVVWTFDGTTWTSHILPQLGTGYAYAWEISADGTVVIGDSAPIPDGGSIRTVWQLKNKRWTILRSGSSSEIDGNVVELAADGKLCIAENSSMSPRLWNLVNGKLITAAQLVASVNQNNSFAGWDFSDAMVQNIGYDSATNSYNIIGYAQYNGQPNYWAVSVYTPFLTGGSVCVGQEISAQLPDHSEGDYQVSNLPSGLTYESKTRTVLGRATKEGIFSIHYRSAAGKTRESVLKVVPFPEPMIGTQTLPLAGAGVGDPSPGTLNVKIGATGILSGSLKLNSTPKAQILKFSGIMVMGASGKFAAAYASKKATSPGILLKFGKGSSAVQLQLSLHMSSDGILIAELRDADNNLIGSGAM